MNTSLAHHQAGSPEGYLRIDRKNLWETDVLEKAQKGDLEAFNDLVRLYQTPVYRQAFYMLNDEDTAEDATQEVFILAYRKLHTFLGGSFRSWLLKITTNYCLDLIRVRRRRTFIPLETFNEFGEEIESPSWLEDPADTPEQAVERAEINYAVQTCIQHLSPKYKMAVVLIDLQEMDYQEAAAVLEIPIGTLKSRLARARIQIQRTLEFQLKRGPHQCSHGDAGRLSCHQA